MVSSASSSKKYDKFYDDLVESYSHLKNFDQFVSKQAGFQGVNNWQALSTDAASSRHDMIHSVQATGSQMHAEALRLGDLNLVSEALSLGPARVLGQALPSLDIGTCPDMVLVSPKERWTLSDETIHSSEKNTPMLGTSLLGRVKMTWVSGELVFDTCVNRKM